MKKSQYRFKTATFVVGLILCLGFIATFGGIGGITPRGRNIVLAERTAWNDPAATTEITPPTEIPTGYWHTYFDFTGRTVADFEGSGTAEDPYLIQDVEDLAFLSYSTGNTFSGVYFKQTADIDLGENFDEGGNPFGPFKWRPIGGFNSSFNGNYDGDGHTIYNMIIDEELYDYLGLFRQLNNATVKNLNIINGYINPHTRTYAGLITSYAVNAKLYNISVHGLITAYSGGVEKGLKGYMGGVVGYYNGSGPNDIGLEKIRNYARVRGTTYVGGIAGRLRNSGLVDCYNAGEIYSDQEGSAASVYLGGMAGLVDTTTALIDNELVFSALLNEGKVYAPNHNRVGGIIGDSTTNKLILMDDVENRAEISGRSYVGGICGIIANVDLTGGKNTGTINGYTDVGGLFGRTYMSELEDVSNGQSGDPAVAKITAANSNAGGIIGHAYRNTRIAGVVNYADIESQTYNSDAGTGGIIGQLRGLNSYIVGKDGVNPANYGTITGFTGGGAIGNANSAQITINDFENYGQVLCQVSTSGIRAAGGLIGYATRANINIVNSVNNAFLQGGNIGGAIGFAQSLSNIYVTSFQNKADLIILDGSDPNPNVASLGGVIGSASATSLHLESVSNTGDIQSGGNNVGGIIGNSSSMDFRLSNSFNDAEVRGASRVGGIAGTCNGQITSVQNYGDVFGSGDYIGGIIGYTQGAKLIDVQNGAEDIDGMVKGLGAFTESTTGINVGGIIGYSHNGAVIDLTEVNNYMDVTGKYCVGGLMGRSTQNTTITDSYNHAVVEAELYYTGGLVGYQVYGILTITNSANYGEVISNYVGTESQSYYATGGIVGAVRNAGTAARLTDVTNYGEVTGQFAGGIMGFNESITLGNIVFERVYNEGNVSNDNLYSGTTLRPGYVGGLLGASTSSAGTAKIIDSANIADITGYNTGGLVGWCYNVLIENSYNEGTIVKTFANSSFGGLICRATRATINNSYNTGDFTINEPVLYGGGLLGYSSGVVYTNINNSYNLSDIDATASGGAYIANSAVGGLIGYSASTAGLQITSSYNKGNINAAAFYVGGLVGRIAHNYTGSQTQRISSITNSYSFADINCNDSVNATYAGGLVGMTDNGLHIKNCDVKGVVSSSYYTGGLVGRAYIYLNIYNIRQDGQEDEIIYNIISVEDCSFIGEVTGGGHSNSARASGSVIGIVEYGGTPTATLTDKDIISLTISKTYTVAQRTGTFAYNKGYIGRAYFSNRNIPNMYVYINDSYYTVDEPDYPALAREPEITYPGSNRQIIFNDNCATLTVGQMKEQESFVGFNFTGGVDRTFWGISYEYNDGFPYHRNMYPGQIVFHANAAGAYFGEGADTFVVDTLVGNNLMLVEYIVPRPVRKYYDFKGWSTSWDGPAQYKYGDLFAGAGKESIDLYAVWAPEQIWVDLQHPAKLYDGDDLASNSYVYRGSNHVIRYTLNNPENEQFLNWEIFNPATGEYEVYTGITTAEGFIPLAAAMDDDFIDTYVYIGEGGNKVFKIRQVVTGLNEMISVNFVEGSPQNPGNFTINGDAYRTGNLVEVPSGEVMTLAVNARAHYKVKSITFKDASGQILSDVDYTSPSANVFNITVTGRMNIEVELEKIAYPVSIKIVENAGDEDVLPLDLISGDENTIEAKLGEPLPDFEPVVNDDYRFIGFKVYDYALNKYVTYTNDTPISQSFLSNHVGPQGNLVIYAVFIQRFEIKVTAQFLDDGQGIAGEGVIKIYKVESGQHIQLTSDTNILDKGSVITLEAIPGSGSTFEGFEGLPAGATVSGATARFTVESDLNIAGAFKFSVYTIQTLTVNSSGNQIEGVDNILVGDGTQDEVWLGSNIDKIGFKQNELSGYQFMGWFIKVGDQLKPVTQESGFTFDTNGFITNVEITADFIADYIDPISKNLILVAQYYEKYTVTLEVSDSSMGGYELYEMVNGSPVAISGEQSVFVHGTILKIKAVVFNADYYNFSGFEGKLNEDQLADNDTALIIEVLGNRNITLNFRSNEFEFVESSIKTSAKGQLKVSTTDIKINDQVVISFTPEFGYEIRVWYVYDKTGKSHNISDLGNITRNGNTLILTVDEEWMDQFGPEFKSEVHTMMNSIYLTVLLVSAITIPLLIAGIIIYSIQNSRKKAAAAAARQRAEILKRALSAEDFMKKLKEEADNE